MLSGYSVILNLIAELFNGSVYSRTRTLNDKCYFSLTVMAFNGQSISEVLQYFDQHELMSSKRLDYLAWKQIVLARQANPLVQSYLNFAIEARKNFNSTRTQFD